MYTEDLAFRFCSSKFSSLLGQNSAKKLKDEGAEVVAFDMDKPETFGPAFEDAYGLFVVTNFWEHMNPQKEIDQAEAIARAAEEAGVEHIVWSTLEDTTKFYDGVPEKDRVPKIKGYYVPHFDAKGKANEKFPKSKTTFFYTSFYWENFYNFGMAQNGVVANNVGEGNKLAGIAVEDIGKCALGVFKAGKKYKEKSVYVAGEVLPFSEMLEICSKVTGKKFSYQPVDRETYAGFGFPGADDLANMFHYNVHDQTFNANRSPVISKQLNPSLQNFQQWAESKKEQLLTVAPKD